MLSCSLSSCRFNFNKSDLIPFNIYDANDTLVFVADHFQPETFVITQKVIKHYGWNENSGIWSKPTAILFYSQCLPDTQSLKISKKDDGDLEFMVIEKSTPDSKSFTELAFHHGISFLPDSAELVNEVLPGGTQLIVQKIPEAVAHDSADVVCKYWHTEYGIVGYDYKCGTRWRLQRFNQKNF